MKYLIFAVTTLFAAQCALAQSTAPPEATKPVAKQPAVATDAAAAKNVGTKDKTVAVDAYLKAQEKKKTARAKKQAARQSNSETPAAETGVRASSLMTDDERAEHRKKLQTFATLDECQKYEKDYQAKVEARAKEQHKTLRPPNADACNRYKVAAGTPATAVAKPVSDTAKPATKQ